MQPRKKRKKKEESKDLSESNLGSKRTNLSAGFTI
jgi:hypothetical protein